MLLLWPSPKSQSCAWMVPLLRLAKSTFRGALPEVCEAAREVETGAAGPWPGRVTTMGRAAINRWLPPGPTAVSVTR